MLLELGKMVSFVLCILSLYSVLLSAFFVPNTSWHERLMLGLVRLAVAGCVSFASGLLFAFPSRTNPDRGVPLWKSLPVVVFFWAAVLLSLMFLIAWYLRCGNPDVFGSRLDCS